MLLLIFRFRACLRVKRGIINTARKGGLYKDQIYFEGAMKILKKRREINFKSLYSGKISLDDLERMQKKLRTICLKLPWFMQNIEEYVHALDIIAKFNGIS